MGGTAQQNIRVCMYLSKYVEKATYFVDILNGFREVSLTPDSQGGVDIILDGVTYCSNLKSTNYFQIIYAAYKC